MDIVLKVRPLMVMNQVFSDFLLVFLFAAVREVDM
jgi:hypothetical protein